MELIASSRIVKAQQRVEASRPYAVQLTDAMEDLARQSGSLSHPLLEERPQPTKAGPRPCSRRSVSAVSSRCCT
jgi:F-type H+-transporting ATPase subunit gamma